MVIGSRYNLKNNNSVTMTTVTLHSFSDASEKAYAAVVYLRHEYEDKSVTTRLIASKTRLSPIRSVRNSNERCNILGGYHERVPRVPRSRD